MARYPAVVSVVFTLMFEDCTSWRAGMRLDIQYLKVHAMVKKESHYIMNELLLVPSILNIKRLKLVIVIT